MTIEPNLCGRDMTADELQELAPSYALRMKQDAQHADTLFAPVCRSCGKVCYEGAWMKTGKFYYCTAVCHDKFHKCTCQATEGQIHPFTCPVFHHQFRPVTAAEQLEVDAHDDYTLQVPEYDTPLAENDNMDLAKGGVDWESAISKEDLLRMRRRLATKADVLLEAKGNDYNSAQQNAGDTLFNLRVASILGIVPTPVDGILVRLSDKFMRLVSLTRPNVQQKVKDESLEDTVLDIWNYSTYVLAMLRRSKGEAIE